MSDMLKKAEALVKEIDSIDGDPWKDLEKAKLMESFFNVYADYLIEQAKRAEKNAEDLHDMDLQILTQQKEINQLKEEVKHYKGLSERKAGEIFELLEIMDNE